MRVGVPREIKDQELRVSLTPAGAHELVRLGHDVLVEASAGADPGSATTTTSLRARGSSPAPTRCGRMRICC